MTRRMLVTTTVLALVDFGALALAGCGNKDAQAQTCSACGMKDVPEAQLTEIDGKWYCAGCARKVAADHPGHGNG